MRVTLKEGSAAERSYRFRAPDPPWVAASMIERARRALHEFDPRLSIWWSPTRGATWDPDTPGRWRIVEWMPRQANWTTVFYWEGPKGQYRAPEPIEPILLRLAAADVPMDVLDRSVEEEQERAGRKRKDELRDACREQAEDLGARKFGIRQTFGPGYIRRREVKASDLRETNFTKFVAEHRQRFSGAVRRG